jgi:hypothetical protein
MARSAIPMMPTPIPAFAPVESSFVCGGKGIDEEVLNGALVTVVVVSARGIPLADVLVDDVVMEDVLVEDILLEDILVEDILVEEVVVLVDVSYFYISIT